MKFPAGDPDHWEACLYTDIFRKFKSLLPPQCLLWPLSGLITEMLTCSEQGLPCAIIQLVMRMQYPRHRLSDLFSDARLTSVFFTVLESSELEYSKTELQHLLKSHGLPRPKEDSRVPSF